MRCKLLTDARDGSTKGGRMLPHAALTVPGEPRRRSLTPAFPRSTLTMVCAVVSIPATKKVAISGTSRSTAARQQAWEVFGCEGGWGREGGGGGGGQGQPRRCIAAAGRQPA